MELEYQGKQSDLINKIFRENFKRDICDHNIKYSLIEEQKKIIEYVDTSVHGSPIWEQHRTFEGQKLYNLYLQLIDIYYLLLSIQKIN